jgi:hypothetical protein
VTAVTTLLCDVGVGNTTTYEEVVAPSASSLFLNIIVDLGAETQVTSVVAQRQVTVFGGGQAVYRSNDGSTWTQAGTSNSDMAAGSISIPFTGVSARYWRWRFSGGAGFSGPYYRVSDLRLYNGATLLTPTA